MIYHHRQGLALIVARFGADALRAAERHILEDEGSVPEGPAHYRTSDPQLIALVATIYAGCEAAACHA